MNKNAIKKFAIEARKKLIDSVTDKAGMLGITEKSCSKPSAKGSDFEVYQTVAGTEVTLNRKQCEQRRRLVSQIQSRGFEAVVEEVAYTWFNRICAIRFMEVNDYLPNRVRVLSSEKEGKMEPDLVTQAPDVELALTAQEKEEIINWKLSGTSEDTDKLYCKLFLKQCHQLYDILPGLFEADSDYMELLFSISYTNKDDVIYMLVNPKTGIPENDFNVSALDEEGNPTGQVEIIGWLYQYYNTELNNQVYDGNMSKSRISKELLPAATTIYTPDWAIRYMVENSIGKLWIEHLRAVDPTTDEKAAAERFGWKYYLSEAEQEEAVNVKLVEIRSTYKDLKPTDIMCIDPCMGSGHILIAIFDVLMDIYESAGYDKREAVFEIVKHNIHGLDIDQRAYQLAYFAVMMKGRGYNRRFLRGRDGKPEPKVYAIVESNEINRKHLQFFGTHLSEMERNLAVMQIEGLLDTFKDAREYGSILNVDTCDWDVLERFVADLSTTGQISFESVGSEETQESLRKLIKVAKNLGQKYDVVVTNPPYLSSSRFSQKLDKYVKEYYSEVKADLSMIMYKHALRDFCKSKGYVSFITTSSWMFLSSFEKLRLYVMKEYDFNSIVDFGTELFEGKVGHNPIVTWVNRKFNTDSVMTGIRLVDFCYSRREEKKKEFFNLKNYHYVNPSEFSKIPGNPVAYWLPHKVFELYANGKTMEMFAHPKVGMQTSNNDKYLRMWFEIAYNEFNGSSLGLKWIKYLKGGAYRKWYGNLEYLLFYNNDKNFILQQKNARVLDLQFLQKKKCTWTDLTSGNNSFRLAPDDTFYDISGHCFFPTEEDQFWLLAYANSVIFSMLKTMFNSTFHCQVGDVAKIVVPDLNMVEKQSVTELSRNNVAISKCDWDAFETSWDFQHHPLLKKKRTIVESFEEWNTECNNQFEKMKTNEEKINRIFINSFGLQGELTPTVEDKDITVRNADLSRDIRSLVSYAVGCMFGRYSLDQEGLIYAGGNFDKFYKIVEEPLLDMIGEEILDSNGETIITGERYGKIKINNEWMDVTFSPDLDNCIPITDEEYFTDDIVARFVEFIKTVYGADTLEENLDFIANALGNKGATSKEVIRNYFLKDFYKDHLKTYQKRPIYWMFDSGKQNGFKALIYMHRYDADTVGRVRTDYLHQAQRYVETAMQSAQYTIDNASSASEKSKATKAVTKYTKQLAEMKIYDEAIAHIANQRIEINLDDGVKVNYAKFQGVEVAQEGKKALKVDLLAKIK